MTASTPHAYAVYFLGRFLCYIILRFPATLRHLIALRVALPYGFLFSIAILYRLSLPYGFPNSGVFGNDLYKFLSYIRLEFIQILNKPRCGAGLIITILNDSSYGLSPLHIETNAALYYSKMEPSDVIIQSYILSRYLSSKERLDSRNHYVDGVTPNPNGIPEQCGMFKETTSLDSNNNSLHDNTCYLMIGGATVLGHSPKMGIKIMKTDPFQPSV